MKQIKLEFDASLGREKSTIQTLNQFSQAIIITLLPHEPEESVFFTWITPGGLKLQERVLWRNSEYDESGLYAYLGNIYPGMTTGIPNSMDAGTARMAVRAGALLSPYVKIPVHKSIIPEQTELQESNVDDIVAQINLLDELKLSRSGALPMLGDIDMSGNSVKNLDEVNSHTFQVPTTPETADTTDAVRYNELKPLLDVERGRIDLRLTEAQINALVANKSDVGHSHIESDISDLDKYTQNETNSLLDTKLDVSVYNTFIENFDLDGDM